MFSLVENLCGLFGRVAGGLLAKLIESFRPVIPGILQNPISFETQRLTAKYIFTNYREHSDFLI